MQTPDVLRERIIAAGGRGGLAACRSFGGAWDFGHFHVFVDWVQKDLGASPTRLRVRVDQGTARFPKRFVSTPDARRATADWIARQAEAVARRRSADPSAQLGVDTGGPAVLERTAVDLRAETVELRLHYRIATDSALALSSAWERLFFSDLPTLAREALLFDSSTSDQLRQHVECVEDQAQLRARLPELGWVAFLADGTPIDEARSRDEPGPVLNAPEALRQSVTVTNGDTSVGLALPEGVTVVVGGERGWQSALLAMVSAGIHDHPEAHPRSGCVTRGDAWHVVPEEGRAITEAPVGWFARDEAAQLSAARATVSESLAAGVVEAIEAGAKVLLLDERRCPASFLCQHATIRSLLEQAGASSGNRSYGEIARQLYEQMGISSVIATASCGDLADEADTVLVAEGSELHCLRSGPREPGEREPLPALPPRVPDPGSLSSQRGGKGGKVSVTSGGSIVFGMTEIPLGALEVLRDPSQLRAIGDALEAARRKGLIDGARSLAEVAAAVAALVERDGLEAISPHMGRHPGDYASFRALDLAAALQRYPGIRFGGSSEPLAEGPPAEPARRRRRSRRARGGEESVEPVATVEEAPEPPPVTHEAEAKPASRSRRGRRKAPEAKRLEEAQPEAPAPPAPPPAAEPEAAEAEAKPASRSRRGRRKPAEAKRTAEVQPEAPAPPPPAAEPTPLAPEAKPASRSRRGRRKPADAKRAAETQPEAPAPPAAPPSPAAAEPEAKPAARRRAPRRRSSSASRTRPPEE